MGNICCQEPSNESRLRKQIIPTHYKDPQSQAPSKTAQQQQFEEQKALLHDFSYAVRNLKNNAVDNPNPTYKGVYLHNLKCSDQISEYFTATLVEQNDQFKPSVVKKILKEKVKTQYFKKSLTIEYLVTSHHRSNFIVRSMFYYEDYSYLYLYFNLSSYVHLSQFMNTPQFNEQFRSNLQTNIRFIIAGVILGLEQLHNLHIVYRGVNFQNIVIKENGYPLLTNLCSLHPQGNSLNIIYSTQFTSPQQFRNQPVRRSADLWSLGVLTFFMLTGNFPNSFISQQIYPLGVSPQISDFINRLLVLDPEQRLGANNINELKFHPFFYGFSWQSYQNLELISPFSRQQHNEYGTIYDQHCDYHEQSRFDYNYSTGLMAGMLFMEMGTILLISNLYDQQYSHQLDLNENQNMHSGNLASNYVEHGCAVELSDDGHCEDVEGGDYD